MKRSTFILVVVGALAVPVFLARQYRERKLGAELATSVETDAEVEDTSPTSQVVQASPHAAKITSIAVKQDDSDEFDVEQKKKAVIELVDRGLDSVNKNSVDKSFSLFTHGREFIDGELYLFVYDMDGICLAHGQSPEMIWQNKIDLRDPYGTYIIRDAIAVAQSGGGWMTYQWRNATKVSYVRPFEKGGKKYLIGSGYYTHAKPDSVVKLVKGAVHYFNSIASSDQSKIDEAFSVFSYPMGRFLQGDLYLYALAYDGSLMANGERPGLIGTNALNDKDEAGNFYNQEIIKKLKDHPEGVWIEYQSRNTTKKVYAEKVKDKKGKEYFIACSYYPAADRNALLDLVRKGYDYLKRHGLSAAAKDFTDRTKNDFRFGDLYLFVYDLTGTCVANGSNPDFVGLNQSNVQDDDGRYYVREIVEKAQKGGGWVDFKIKNGFQSVYAEKVDLGTESYVIGSGLYPVSRRETTLLLVRSAANFLRTRPTHEVFAELGNGNSTFVRGDLSVFVIDFNGISRIYGDNYDLIWRSLMNAKDDDGKEYVKIFINTVKAGPGQVSYTINGVRRVAFVEMVEKDGTSYVVGSGYFI